MEQNASGSRIGIPPIAWVVALILTVAAFAGVYYVSQTGYQHGSELRFVGPLRCAECHEKQAESWAQTRMANSFDALRPGMFAEQKEAVGLDPDADYTHEESCLPCHTTGYGLAGGFVSIEKTPHMAGVTCEACHGAGGMYVGTVMDADDPTFDTNVARQAGLVYPPTARICRRCHNEDSPFIDIGYTFDYEARVAKGTHEHFQLKYDHAPRPSGNR